MSLGFEQGFNGSSHNLKPKCREGSRRLQSAITRTQVMVAHRVDHARGRPPRPFIACEMAPVCANRQTSKLRIPWHELQKPVFTIDWSTTAPQGKMVREAADRRVALAGELSASAGAREDDAQV